jgi:hypothetical protein
MRSGRLRVLIYGTLVELEYEHILKVSRIIVEGHIQLRYLPHDRSGLTEEKLRAWL